MPRGLLGDERPNAPEGSCSPLPPRHQGRPWESFRASTLVGCLDATRKDEEGLPDRGGAVVGVGLAWSLALNGGNDFPVESDLEGNGNQGRNEPQGTALDVALQWDRYHFVI